MNRPKRPVSPVPAAAPGSAAGGWPLWALFAVGMTVLLVVYGPSLRGGFLWDDPGHVTSPALQSWSGLGRIWFEPGATQQYYPLLHTAFWIEHQLWGDAALGYRLVNLGWHALAAVLLVAVLRRLAVPGALFAGLLFALHPVGVESVAWISEQKNTLSTVFYLAAALAWLRFEQDRSPRRYAIATAWFVAALLTKTVTATLPAALLVVAWWQRGRVSWRDDVRPLLPWFGVGVAAGLFTVWFERVGIGAQGADFELSLAERGLLAGRVFWFYLGTLAWPANLAFFYPRWDIDASVAWQYLFPAAGLALLAGVIVWTRRSGGRGVLAALLLFGGTLFPVLGFLNVYPFVFSYVADHFQYLANPSLFALGAAAVATLAGRVDSGAVRAGVWGLAGAMVVGYGVLSWRQSAHYVDSITLYRATLLRSPDSWITHHNLAAELAARGRHPEALGHARRAVELKPDFPEALNNLADNLARTGRAAEALPLLDRAQALQPRYAQAENTRGVALAMLGRAAEAVPHFQRAIEWQPELVEAHFNLGLAEMEQGRFDRAIPSFTTVLTLRPEHADAELNLGIALAVTNRLTEARPHFLRAIALNPEAAPVHLAYGRVLLNAGLFDEAVRSLREALRLDPGLPGLHHDLAFALQQLGRIDEARYHAAEAARSR
jgi:tetratricopeptide (TPR) repeat protein